MLDVKQTLNDASERMEMATMYLGDELQRIRAGRANVAILDGVRVEILRFKGSFESGCLSHGA